MKSIRASLSRSPVFARLATVSLVAVLSCHSEPKALAEGDESISLSPTQERTSQEIHSTLAPDAWADFWRGAEALPPNESTDGLTPEEEEAGARRETSEAFRYTGHALDSVLGTQG